MNVLVLFESKTGNTRKVAELIGGAAQLAGADVVVRQVNEVDLHELSRADVVFLGTWVDGLVLFGHRPGGKKKFVALPTLQNKRVALFCTYAIHGSNAMLKKFGRLMGRKGALVISQRGFKRGDLEDGVMAFIAETFAEVPATSSAN